MESERFISEQQQFPLPIQLQPTIAAQNFEFAYYEFLAVSK